MRNLTLVVKMDKDTYVHVVVYRHFFFSKGTTSLTVYVLPHWGLLLSKNVHTGANSSFES